MTKCLENVFFSFFVEKDMSYWVSVKCVVFLSCSDSTFRIKFTHWLLVVLAISQSGFKHCTQTMPFSRSSVSKEKPLIRPEAARLGPPDRAVSTDSIQNTPSIPKSGHFIHRFGYSFRKRKFLWRNIDWLATKLKQNLRKKNKKIKKFSHIDLAGRRAD